MSRYKKNDEYGETQETEAAEPAPDPVGTPEQLTAAVRYLAGRIGGAAVLEIEHLLGIPPAPVGQ